MVSLNRFATKNELAQACARGLADAIVQAQHAGSVNGDHIARIVLTGGSTGIALLAELHKLWDESTAPAADIDWARVYVYFGDERVVPKTHEDSNERQAREALLDHLPIPADHIIGWDTDTDDLEHAAHAYEQAVKDTAPQGFDVHLLGMGGEGHINSLFPHTAATAEMTRTAIAVTDSPKPPAVRLTLTRAAVNTAAKVWLVVAGADKAEAVAQLVSGKATADELPSAGVQGTEETVLWVDDAALSLS